jgi:PAS domain S-box-containing protein
MSLWEYLFDRLRSKYAVKLFLVSAVIVAAILSFGTAMALQVSDRVTEQQLQSVEANAKLEANALGRWIEGEQESLQILSMRPDIASPPESQLVLNSELDRQSAELAALHVVERANTETSNGTTEEIRSSTDPSLVGEPLAATNINWGENTDGIERRFTFEGPNDLLRSWVYIDGSEPLVAIATPTSDGEHVLIGEYRPSLRVQRSVDMIEGTDTVVLGGISGWVIFDETTPAEFRRYKGRVNSTEVGSRILAREDPNSILNGSEIDPTEVRGYHSVPTDGIDWVVVKETPRPIALELTQQVQSDLGVLIGFIVFGFFMFGVVIQRGPIRAIKRQAHQSNAIANGDLDIDIPKPDRIDEIGQLNESFRNTKEYIETITRQSLALSRQEFDAPVLEETIPGRVGDAMVTMRDDLERFISELETERERYLTLVEQSSDGVAVIQDRQYVFANDRFLEITGYDREMLYGMYLEQPIASGDRQLALERYEKRLDGDEPAQQYELDIQTASGEKRTVELSASRITRDGEQATLVNVRDITDRKRRERRLNIFNRVLRHNLRNNLQPVIAVLQSLSSDETLDPALVETADEQLDSLVRTANNARRIEEAFEDIRISQHDLGAVIERLESKATERYPDGTFVSPTDTATVEGAHVLQDAIWELLENAFEHTGPSPTVTVTIDQNETDATLIIRDDGDGIPENERTALTNGTETDLVHTSGLGLWFAYWIVETSGGSVEFDVADGTTVVVTLPLVE